MHHRTRAAWAVAATAATLASIGLHSPATASPGDHGKAPEAHGRNSDVRPVGPDFNRGKKQPLDRSSVRRSQSLAPHAQAAASDPQVGQEKTWLAEDDAKGSIYAKAYTLRGIGDHIQVWVAKDPSFPAGDCRNALGLTDVTDAQVANFVHEFDTNIYPQESKTFSTPPARDGSKATLPGLVGLPADYYAVDQAQSDDIVVLVDNVRDDNYYAPATPTGQTYIAGFFYSVFNEYVDRNVMTIDAYDWLHRTGATPPDDTTKQPYIDCAASQGSSRPYGAPRPHLYEGTFAHEYQHLLEYYQDPDEVSWVNEGLSDWAQTLVGYVDPTLAPDAKGADSHLSCFMGYQPPSFGGPENSLTAWQDQGAPEILCDYGAAYSFMSYLHGRYGDAFMSALHKNPANGLAGLDATLDAFGAKESAQQLVHQWAAMMALDHAIDQRGGNLKGAHKGDYVSPELDAKINWDNPEAYDTPGAPANGSDYVRLRDAAGTYLSADQLKSLSFEGSKTLEATPVEWQVDSAPPESITVDPASSEDRCGTAEAGSGPPALYSGCGANLDRSIVRPVSVPTDGASLTFDAQWDIEQGWDLAVVQVSDDGGKTWTSLPTADTTTDTDPGAIAAVQQNVPGFTGTSDGFRHETADLSAYAGKDVLIGFRYLTDPAANENGFWVRNIHVGDTELRTTLDGWETMSQANPAPVAGFTVQLVGYAEDGKAWIEQLPLSDDFTARLDAKDLKKALGKKADVVAAIVTYDDPSETSTQEARYRLTVNGMEQPGG